MNTESLSKQISDIQSLVDRLETERVLIPFSETRQDGWPLCPICGEDELFVQMPLSFQPRDLGNTTLMERVIYGYWGCYACEWSWNFPRQLLKRYFEPKRL